MRRTGIDAYLDALVDEDRFSGAFLLAQNGEVLLSRGYGMADRDAGIENTPETQFHIGWMTGQFTAMAVLLLAQEGQVGLHASVCDYIDDCPVDWQPITLHHLLADTAGLNFVHTDQPPLETVIEEIKGKGVPAEPGAGYSAWCSHRMVLAYVVEQVTGQSYEEYVQTAFFEPLGMTRTGFFAGEAEIAVPYVGQNRTGAYRWRAGVNACLGLVSTVNDLYRWREALTGDELFSSELREQMFTAHAEVPDEYVAEGEPPQAAGYGWRIRQNPDGPVYYITGGFNVTGYWSGLFHYTNDGLTLIYLSNQEDMAKDLIASLEAMMFGE